MRTRRANKLRNEKKKEIACVPYICWKVLCSTYGNTFTQIGTFYILSCDILKRKKCTMQT